MNLHMSNLCWLALADLLLSLDLFVGAYIKIGTYKKLNKNQQFFLYKQTAAT